MRQAVKHFGVNIFRDLAALYSARQSMQIWPIWHVGDQVAKIQTKRRPQPNGSSNECDTKRGSMLDVVPLGDPRNVRISRHHILLISRLAHVSVIRRRPKNNVPTLNAARPARRPDDNASKIPPVDPGVRRLAEAVVWALPIDRVESNGEDLDEELVIALEWGNVLGSLERVLLSRTVENEDILLWRVEAKEFVAIGRSVGLFRVPIESVSKPI
ncbi:hypothetical protein IWZ03DRAFT_157024 [Phyllosticta citriasiana]|uniref:Uncharacterized protein n=1 Tax=Phyllosticta citriasiana TaxID=595635 RepID=A0ABR1KPF1_9PEZI